MTSIWLRTCLAGRRQASAATMRAMPIEVRPVCTTAEIMTRNRMAGTVSKHVHRPGDRPVDQAAEIGADEADGAAYE